MSGRLNGRGGTRGTTNLGDSDFNLTTFRTIAAHQTPGHSLLEHLILQPLATSHMNSLYQRSHFCRRSVSTAALSLFFFFKFYELYVSGNASMGLHPCQNNPGTKLVHVVLLEVLELSGVAVDSPSLCSSFLRLITPVHLQVILVQFRALSWEMSNKPIDINMEYL